MGPRSAGFDEIEAGYAQQAAAEEEELEMERGDHDDEDAKRPVLDDEVDELEIAAKEYLDEMSSGMGLAEEEEFAI